jgi:hypothetical protein
MIVISLSIAPFQNKIAILSLSNSIHIFDILSNQLSGMKASGVLMKSPIPPCIAGRDGGGISSNENGKPILVRRGGRSDLW